MKIIMDGHIIESRDDTTRTVTAYDETGAVTSTRPYTDAENAAADAAAAQQAAQAARDALLEEIGRIDAALAAEDDRIQPCLNDGPQTINASPAQYIKHNARALKRIIKAIRDLAEVVRDN